VTVEAAAPPAVQPCSTYVALAAVVAATAGLLFGFDIAVINGAIIFLRAQFGLTEFQTEIAASSLLIGCVFGASCGGWLGDRFGRRRILMLSAVLFVVSSAGAALSRNLAEFMSARFVGGLAIGMASLLAPLYIAEVAPARNRGRLVSLNQMAIVTGILLAYLANWSLAFAGPESWRWMFLVAGVPSIAFLVALFFVPESPRWLLERGRKQEALAVLTRINGSVAGRLLLSEIEGVAGEESQSIRELFAAPLRRRLALAVALAVLSQITGINTVLFYGSIIFSEHVGSSGSSALAVNVAVGLVNLVATLFALWAIDRLGRRPLLMISSGVMALCQGALGAAFLLHPPPAPLVLSIMLVCVAAFAIGLGPGVWVLLSEIFPTRVRGRAMSVATVSLWIACTTLTLTFLSLATALTPAGAFWIYGAMCVLTFLIVRFATPETKGKTLEEIEALLGA
jgi:MFS transporter, SP family, arabinose:H+ symporter